MIKQAFEEHLFICCDNKLLHTIHTPQKYFFSVHGYDTTHTDKLHMYVISCEIRPSSSKIQIIIIAQYI